MSFWQRDLSAILPPLFVHFMLFTTFAATVQIVDIDAPMSCRIVGKGNGGIAGFAKGDCVVNLEEAGATTVLSYKANAEIGGTLTALGGRLIQATSRKFAD